MGGRWSVKSGRWTVASPSWAGPEHSLIRFDSSSSHSACAPSTVLSERSSLRNGGGFPSSLKRSRSQWAYWISFCAPVLQILFPESSSSEMND